ncbi:hypothetical protein HPT25_23395 [Bacillus sp. BRMEA1]|uniref:hypothetical protein n=1 Tax=Neobacillus endophyticus TaxID=2738405 RepID=UPI0015649FEE|nr:hypothetical protein [Neobacillus endophyticus]NRD80271.1 hypothetical protein [Neobacillus endophyticus]
MNELYAKLNENQLMDGDNIILDQYEDGSFQAVDKETFETFFGDVKDNPTYDNLVGIHTFTFGGQSYTKNAEELGYKIHFENWHEKGII